MNVRFIPKNLFKIQTEHQQVLNTVDLFRVSETWLNTDLENLYSLPTFNRFSAHRKSDKAVCVTLYDKHFLDIQPVFRLFSISNSVEKKIVKFHISDKKYLVDSNYRLSPCHGDLLTEEFNELFHTKTNEFIDFHVVI